VTRPDLDLLKGAIDMHAHTAPALFRRPLDDMELAQHAAEYGMRGFVLKDHDSLTTGRAHHVKKAWPNLEPIGAIVLNRSVGGINPHVVQAAIHYGAKVVFMPSNHSQWHFEYFHGISDYPQLGRPQKQLPGPGVTILDQNGKPSPETLQILDLIADAGVCLATGHLSLKEIRLLLEESRKRGITKFLVTHANWALCRLDLEVQRELIAAGAYLEYVAVSCVSPIFWEQKPAELTEWVRELGGDHLVLSSDLGQYSSSPHPEGMRQLLSAMLDLGAEPTELEKMTKANPAKLLDLTA
jgi:hypothetical protein